jgi:hypothetical protein
MALYGVTGAKQFNLRYLSFISKPFSLGTQSIPGKAVSGQDSVKSYRVSL